MSENKILFAGDPHGCFKNIISSVQEYSPDAVIILGGFNLKAPLEQYLESIIDKTNIYWIPGNHDFDSVAEYEYLFHSPLADYNLHLKVIEISGIRVAGLGGIFAGRIWMPSEIPKWKSKQHWLDFMPTNIKKIPLKMDNAIWFHEFETMRKKIRADILVTHEAPSCYPRGFQVIDELATAIGAKKVFHGHHHTYYNKELNNGISVTGTALGGVVNLLGEQLR